MLININIIYISESNSNKTAESKSKKVMKKVEKPNLKEENTIPKNEKLEVKPSKKRKAPASGKKSNKVIYIFCNFCYISFIDKFVIQCLNPGSFIFLGIKIIEIIRSFCYF